MGRENCSTLDLVRLPYELVWNRELGGRGEDNPKQLSKMKNKPWDSDLDQEGPKQVDETDFCAVFRAKEDWVGLRNDWGWKDGAVWVKLDCKQGWGRGEGPLSASHTLGRLWGRWALDWAWKRELDTAMGIHQAKDLELWRPERPWGVDGEDSVWKHTRHRERS